MDSDGHVIFYVIIFYRFSPNNAMDIPEIKEAAEFMEFMLGDCSGDEDKTFLTLRVYVVFVYFTIISDVSLTWWNFY